MSFEFDTKSVLIGTLFPLTFIVSRTGCAVQCSVVLLLCGLVVVANAKRREILLAEHK
jgi:hypothetical protein